MKLQLFTLSLVAAGLVTPATLQALEVQNANDAGPGSLRQAIADAPAGDTITFASSLKGQAIALSSAQLMINKNLRIVGPGADLLAVERGSADGVFRIFEINSRAAVAISGLTLRNGQDEAVVGGAIYVHYDCALDLTDCSLSGNRGISGGAIMNHGSLNITGCALWANRAADGGALVTDAQATVLNSTFSGNLATSAGAISNYGNLTLSHVTVVNNETWGETGDAAIVSSLSLTVRNSILGNNSRRHIFSFDPVTWEGVNFFTSPDLAPGATEVPWTGPGGLNLGPLQNNGGHTPTHALPPGSIAVDAVADSSGAATDQRGFARPQGGRADAGAFEFKLNSAPEIACGAPYVFQCAPAGGVPFAAQVAVTDLDPGQTLTVRMMNRGAVVDTQTIATPVNNGLVTFRQVTALLGTHELVFEISDGLKTATCNTTITVGVDTEAPVVVSTPADLTLSCNSGPYFAEPVFSDAGDANLSVTSEDAPLPLSGKEIAKLRRTWTATDAAGHAVSTSQVISYVDVTAPVFDSVPANVSVTATSAAGATVNYPEALASDACNGAVVTYSKATGTLFPVGVTTVTCTATDAVGNQTAASFTVTVAPQVNPPTPAVGVQLDALIAVVGNLSLDKGKKTELLVKLTAVKTALAAGRDKQAGNALENFENKIEQLLKQGRVTGEQAAQLKAAVENILAAIGTL